MVTRPHPRRREDIVLEGYEMTAETLEALRAEIEQLETTERARIVQEIKTAREFGDLKENAEYHAAKDAQGHLEARIARLNEQLRNAVVVDAKSGGDVVGFGSKVELADEDTGKRLTYELVSARDAAPGRGLVSVDSPVGSALRGLRTGEVAEVATPRGARRLTVLGVN